jgi:hypothetical protein
MVALTTLKKKAVLAAALCDVGSTILAIQIGHSGPDFNLFSKATGCRGDSLMFIEDYDQAAEENTVNEHRLVGE